MINLSYNILENAQNFPFERLSWAYAFQLLQSATLSSMYVTMCYLWLEYFLASGAE